MVQLGNKSLPCTLARTVAPFVVWVGKSMANAQRNALNGIPLPIIIHARRYARRPEYQSSSRKCRKRLMRPTVGRHRPKFLSAFRDPARCVERRRWGAKPLTGKLAAAAAPVSTLALSANNSGSSRSLSKVRAARGELQWRRNLQATKVRTDWR